jgi:hypothetical protein
MIFNNHFNLRPIIIQVTPINKQAAFQIVQMKNKNEEFVSIPYLYIFSSLGENIVSLTSIIRIKMLFLCFNKSSLTINAFYLKKLSQRQIQ